MNKKANYLKLVTYFLLIMGAISMLLPFIWMITTSFKSEAEVFIFPPKLFGEKFLWQNYKHVSDRFDFILYFMNSVKVSAWVVIFQLITSSMAGFVFAKLKFKGRDKIFLIYLGTMMIPIQVTTITNFITMTKLGLVNTLWSLMLPPMVSAFGTFLMRQFYATIPTSLYEAAKIDGCNPIKSFFKIYLPLSKASLATLGIFCFMGIWNDYFTPLIYITDSRYYTLPLGLATMKGLYATNWTTLMCASTISIIPILLAFLLAQDLFVKGIALSGLKD